MEGYIYSIGSTTCVCVCALFYSVTEAHIDGSGLRISDPAEPPRRFPPLFSNGGFGAFPNS